MTQKYFIDINGVELYYRITDNLDSKRPVVLFGHSYLWTGDMWREQVEHLQEKFICIIPDLPAHGASGVFADKVYSIEKLAELHWQFMQTLHVERFSVVGISVGGMWGTQLALQHPEAVQALVMMDTFVGPEPEEKRQLYFDLLESIEQDNFTEEQLDYIAPFFLTPDTLANNKDLVERLKMPLREHNNNDERRSHLCALGRCIFTRTSLLEQLKQLAMPIHIIVGDQDVPRPEQESRVMAEHCQQCDLTVVENAGHISNLEQVEIVTETLDQFLTQHLIN